MSTRWWVSSTMAMLAVAIPLAATAHGDAPAHAADGATAKTEQTPFGIAGVARRASRTVDIVMSDAMRFSPSSVRVRTGETVRFRVTNKGASRHEMVLGTLDDLRRHAALMRKFPEMEHSDPFIAHVAPGETGEIVWTFNRPGRFHFACLVAGHFEAGMMGRILVDSGS